MATGRPPPGATRCPKEQERLGASLRFSGPTAVICGGKDSGSEAPREVRRFPALVRARGRGAGRASVSCSGPEDPGTPPGRTDSRVRSRPGPGWGEGRRKEGRQQSLHVGEKWGSSSGWGGSSQAPRDPQGRPQGTTPASQLCPLNTASSPLPERHPLGMGRGRATLRALRLLCPHLRCSPAPWLSHGVPPPGLTFPCPAPWEELALSSPGVHVGTPAGTPGRGACPLLSTPLPTVQEASTQAWPQGLRPP